MLADGFIIMLVGMAVVFSFLVLIIVTMRIMSGIILKFFPEKEEVAVSTGSRSDDSEIAAAIAAVKAYTQS